MLKSNPLDYYCIRVAAGFFFLSYLALFFKFFNAATEKSARGEVKNKLKTARYSRCCIYTHYHDGVTGSPMLEWLQGSATRDLFKHCSLVLGMSNQSTQCWGWTFIFLSTDIGLSVSIEEVITCLSNRALCYLFTVPQGNSCGFQKICVSGGCVMLCCQPVVFSCTVYTVVDIFAQMSVDRFIPVWVW